MVGADVLGGPPRARGVRQTGDGGRNELRPSRCAETVGGREGRSCVFPLYAKPVRLAEPMRPRYFFAGDGFSSSFLASSFLAASFLAASFLASSFFGSSLAFTRSLRAFARLSAL